MKICITVCAPPLVARSWRATADGVSPPLPFRVVKGAIDGGISKPAMCGTDEMMISATCIVKAGDAALAPRTLGETGASCDAKPGQADPPQAVILCTKP